LRGCQRVGGRVNKTTHEVPAVVANLMLPQRRPQSRCVENVNVEVNVLRLSRKYDGSDLVRIVWDERGEVAGKGCCGDSPCDLKSPLKRKKKVKRGKRRTLSRVADCPSFCSPVQSEGLVEGQRCTQTVLNVRYRFATFESRTRHSVKVKREEADTEQAQQWKGRKPPSIFCRLPSRSAPWISAQKNGGGRGRKEKRQKRGHGADEAPRKYRGRSVRNSGALPVPVRLQRECEARSSE
jgi:hypothetical protein